MIQSGEVTGTFETFDFDGFGELFAEEQKYDLLLKLKYNWSPWDRFVNSLLWNFNIVNYRLPEYYEVRIPNAKITDFSTSDERIRVDWKV